jgi:hypothetical protein
LVGLVLVLVAFTLVTETIVGTVALLLDIRSRTTLTPRLASSVRVTFVVVERAKSAASKPSSENETNTRL